MILQAFTFVPFVQSDPGRQLFATCYDISGGQYVFSSADRVWFTKQTEKPLGCTNHSVEITDMCLFCMKSCAWDADLYISVPYSKERKLEFQGYNTRGGGGLMLLMLFLSPTCLISALLFSVTCCKRQAFVLSGIHPIMAILTIHSLAYSNPNGFNLARDGIFLSSSLHCDPDLCCLAKFGCQQDVF